MARRRPNEGEDPTLIVDPFGQDERHGARNFVLAAVAEAIILSGAVAWYIWGRAPIPPPPQPKPKLND